jgi:hypothetical protein
MAREWRGSVSVPQPWRVKRDVLHQAVELADGRGALGCLGLVQRVAREGIRNERGTVRTGCVCRRIDAEPRLLDERQSQRAGLCAWRASRCQGARTERGGADQLHAAVLGRADPLAADVHGIGVWPHWELHRAGAPSHPLAGLRDAVLAGAGRAAGHTHLEQHDTNRSVTLEEPRCASQARQPGTDDAHGSGGSRRHFAEPSVAWPGRLLSRRPRTP